jgi:hypothetical protein
MCRQDFNGFQQISTDSNMCLYVCLCVCVSAEKTTSASSTTSTSDVKRAMSSLDTTSASEVSCRVGTTTSASEQRLPQNNVCLRHNVPQTRMN